MGIHQLHFNCINCGNRKKTLLETLVPCDKSWNFQVYRDENEVGNLAEGFMFSSGNKLKCEKKEEIKTEHFEFLFIYLF